MELRFVGITNSALQCVRKIMGSATGFSCGGSSLTARLAVGGKSHAELDPAVEDANPPLMALISRLWERPHMRADFVFAWRAARSAATGEDAGKWHWVRGPVGAAMTTMQRLEAKWKSPFLITLLNQEIDILQTPPAQVREIIKAHARWKLDLNLIDRWVVMEGGGDLAVVKERYKFGIDWALLRNVLRGKTGDIAPAERHALKAVVCGCFWPEERRWLAGLTREGTCSACFEAIGSARHRLHDCEPLRVALDMAVWADRLPRAAAHRRWDPALAPLEIRGLPPKAHLWQPTLVEEQVGDLSYGHTGTSFGDGSGLRQDQSELRVATWAVVRLCDPDPDSNVASAVSGNVGGWFPTVPRAELSALIWHLRSALAPATYVGDCKSVIDGILHGVSSRLTGARGLHADLWREAARLLKDHGCALSFDKTKAHRSRQAAEESVDDPAWYWAGNGAADHHAKKLCHSMADKDKRVTAEKVVMEESVLWLSRIGFAANWCFQHWPAARRQRRTLGDQGSWKSQRVGGHDLVENRPGKWRCVSCAAYAEGSAGLQRLRRDSCRGTVASRAHHSHRLIESGSTIWCCVCAAHARRVPRALKRQCLGAPRSQSYIAVLKRLKHGLSPTASVSKGSGKPIRPRIINRSIVGAEVAKVPDGRTSRGQGHVRSGTAEHRDETDAAAGGGAVEAAPLVCLPRLGRLRMEKVTAECGCGKVTCLHCVDCGAQCCLACGKANVPHLRP
jgi:hypothetical protein